jgi:glycosidase
MCAMRLATWPQACVARAVVWTWARRPGRGWEAGGSVGREAEAGGGCLRRAALAAPILAGLLPLLALGSLGAAPRAIALDGVRETEYTLLASDPADDLAPGLASDEAWRWAEVSALYVATDTTTLYVYVDLPLYAQDESTGQFGLAIDTSGDVPGAGGGFDPWGNAITYHYTSTHNNAGGTPAATSNVVLPEFVIRGWIPGITINDNGWTELRAWDGAAWAGLGANWGGLDSGDQVGARIAYEDNAGVELAIPFADLGVGPAATVHLQFYVARGGVPHGSYDSVPSDAQASGPGQATTLTRLATSEPSNSPEPTPTPDPTTCAGAISGDGVVATDGLYHHDGELAYRSPLGAIAIGAAATLRQRTCADDVSQAEVLVWQTGEALAAPPDVYTMSLKGASGGYATWAASVPAPAVQVDQWYQFRLTEGGTTSYYRPASGNYGPGAWSATLGQPTWKLGTLPAQGAGYEVPGWLRDAVIYQIVLDRFRNGDAGNDPAGSENVYGPATCGGGACTTRLHGAWNEAPDAPGYGVDFYGGDLQGVLEQVQAGYFDDLGVNVLLLSPPFESSSNHGRDTNDYYAIAPRYGTSATLAALISTASAHGIRVMLEAELGYAGADSVYMDGYGADRWPGLTGACEAGLSPFREWFIEGGAGGGLCQGGWGWQGWLGNETLAEFVDSDALRAFFFQGGSAHSPDGVAVTAYWQALALAGWRFNAAEGLSHAWLAAMRPYLKALDPDTVVMGEVGSGCDSTLAPYLSYLHADELDTLTNDCLRDWVIGLAMGSPSSGFAARLSELQAAMPPQAFSALMNPLSGPSAPRALTLLGGEVARLRLAALVQMTLPGAPAVFYGDEVGVAGGNEPDNRRTYPWADEGGTPDPDLYGYFRQVIGLRRTHGALRGAGLSVLMADDADNLLAYARSDGAETAIVVVNNGPTSEVAVVPVAGHLATGTVVSDVLNAGGQYTVTNGVLTVPVPGLSGAVLVGPAGGEQPIIAMAVETLSVAEGAGTAAVAVQVSGTPTQTITVTVSSVPGTAGADDFVPAAGDVVFAPGQTSRTFLVTLIDDPVEENAETFEVHLTAPVNAALGSPASARVTIMDDDQRERKYLPLVGR